MEVTLNEGTIDLFTKMMCTPQNMGIPIKSLKEVFVESDSVTPKHELYNRYAEYLDGRPIPKVVFYIVMNKVFGREVTQAIKDPHGNTVRSDSGFYLKFNEDLNNK